MAYGSGNLAQVYFDLFPRKILLSELEEAYPGMVDALVQHEGIGFVCGYGDDGVPVVLGKTRPAQPAYRRGRGRRSARALRQPGHGDTVGAASSRLGSGRCAG